ncbi:MAG: 6-pyruvoyl trahydropterin synthase family protein [Planctomycetota bacterium]
MHTVIVETNFRASHQLQLPSGSREPLHEHQWKVSVQVTRKKLNKMGLVIDFHYLKGLVDSTVSDINGHPLEKTEFFQKNNSSAENVAKYIYEKLETILPKSVQLNNITITEENGCLAKFEK